MVGLNIKKKLDKEKNKNELLQKELIYSNNLIISLVKTRDITETNNEIKKLKKELLLSDLRNSGLLKIINELREELNIYLLMKN